MAHGDRAKIWGNAMSRHDLWSRRASLGKTVGWDLDRAAKTRTHRIERLESNKATRREMVAAQREPDDYHFDSAMHLLRSDDECGVLCGEAFDWLRDEPDLYTEQDGEPTA